MANAAALAKRKNPARPERDIVILQLETRIVRFAAGWYADLESGEFGDRAIRVMP
jgi:hypothetical protein